MKKSITQKRNRGIIEICFFPTDRRILRRGGSAEKTENTAVINDWRADMTEERTVQDSLVETVHMIRPNHMNAAGRLFGGMLMQWLDEVAGLVAKRHTRSNVITASVDNLRFIHGAYSGEMVVIIGKATYVGNTSMEVRVDTYVEHLEDGMRHPINRAYFTMVALDENDRPKRVPRLVIRSEEEKAEWEAAEKRREMRMKRKAEGF